MSICGRNQVFVLSVCNFGLDRGVAGYLYMHFLKCCSETLRQHIIAELIRHMHPFLFTLSSLAYWSFHVNASVETRLQPRIAKLELIFARLTQRGNVNRETKISSAPNQGRLALARDNGNPSSTPWRFSVSYLSLTRHLNKHEEALTTQLTWLRCMILCMYIYRGPLQLRIRN
jgi:hypothetical protein